MSTSETTPSPQGASRGVGAASPSPNQPCAPREPLEGEYLRHLCKKLSEWQQIIFNSAQGGNAIGLRIVAAEIQKAAYELRREMGMPEIEAKMEAGVPLNPEELSIVKERLDEQSRKDAVQEFQRGLHG